MSGGQTAEKACQEKDGTDPPRCFGDQITADHFVANAEKSQGLTGDKDALVIKDSYTKYVEGHRCQRKALTTHTGHSAISLVRSFKSTTCGVGGVGKVC